MPRSQKTGQKAQQRRRLLKAASIVADLSCAGLKRLNAIFVNALNVQQWLVGPKTFRLALAQHGIRDQVMQHRLFSELMLEPRLGENSKVPKLDYRDFVCLLAIVAAEPVEAKLEVIFDIFDNAEQLLDGQRSDGLTVPEMMHAIMLEQAKEDRMLIQSALELILGEIRNAKAVANGEADDYWMTPARTVGLNREELMDALKTMPIVHEFFSRVLSEQAEHAKAGALMGRAVPRKTPGAFADRLKELTKIETTNGSLASASMPALQSRRSSWRGDDREEADEDFLRKYKGVRRPTLASR